MLDDQALDWNWGGWVLGDLTHALSRAGEVVGQGADVIGVQATPPSSGHDLPAVTLVLATELEVTRLRSEVADGPYPVGFVEDDGERGWSAEVLGIRLEVTVEGGGTS